MIGATTSGTPISDSAVSFGLVTAIMTRLPVASTYGLPTRAALTTRLPPQSERRFHGRRHAAKSCIASNSKTTAARTSAPSGRVR